MSAGLRRWFLGTTSRATLVRHWRSVIVRRRYYELQYMLRDDTWSRTPAAAGWREELRTLEKVV